MKAHALSLLVFLAVLAAPFAGLAEGEKWSTAQSATIEIQQPDAPSFLPGRIWQLVEIVSMNDRIDAPDDPSLYTVQLTTDGTAQIRADCNRGTGSWQSTSPGQLQFGQIAATQAQCASDSLHDRYMAQFPWVRSYVVKDGHLFLATMADGSIIEFEPVELPLAATVPGEEVRTSDGDEMRGIVLARSFNRSAEDHGIVVKDKEIDSFVEKMQHDMGTMGLTAEADLSDQEKTQVSQPASAKDVPAAPEDGGPLNWQVSGASGGLNLRAEPSTSATKIASYPEGTILDNLGCQRSGDRAWCDVQQFGGGPRGYVAAEYLTPAVSPSGAAVMGPDDSALRAGQGEFDATGPIPCARYKGQPMGSCEFGVARTGGGYATVVITRSDGTKRAVFFRMGVAAGADTSQADGYPEFRVTKEYDLHMIRIGDERYEIPDAVIFGG